MLCGPPVLCGPRGRLAANPANVGIQAAESALEDSFVSRDSWE